MIIREYDPIYASDIARMWNNSGEGWNGYNFNHTEKSVRDKEAVSSHLNLYLAFLDGKVVGYCKLSKYYYDENTLYIDLLNVDPQYHNRKIGKALVIKAVERTLELAYPRLDLFTWAGNTKAVPLYKKCGFFWEKMETNSTHLMNFIPTVIQTPLLRDYFESMDWYDDSTRPIVVEADGRTENNFDIYTYSWEKAGKNLRVDFEKNGRGIHSIETDEILVRTEISNARLVFGQPYRVKYHFTNKGNLPKHLEIKGISNKNIRFELDQKTELLNNLSIEGDFYLDPIDVEQSIWKTHPVVCAEISVDGKSAILKTGIYPQFPLKIEAASQENQMFAGREKELFVNLENNFTEDCRFELSFPPQKAISFAQEKVDIEMKAHERTNIPLKVSVTNSLVYKQRLEVKACFADGREFCYSQPFTMTNIIPEGRAWGENSKRSSIINANKLLILDKDDDLNEVIFENLNNDLYWYQGFPKLGMPYSSEFLAKHPEKVEYSEEENAIILKAYFCSGDFPGCEIVTCYKLFNSGLMEHYTELLSFPAGQDEVVLSRNFGFEGRKKLFPYSGMLIQADDCLHNDSELTNWDGDKIDENWFHCSANSGNMSIVWHPEDKLLCCEYNYAIEHRFRKGGPSRTNSMFVAFDVFPNAKKLREFALGRKVEAVLPKSFYDLQVNGGNPFWDAESAEMEKSCLLTYQDYRQKPLDCTVELSSLQGLETGLKASASKEEDLHQLCLDLHPCGDFCIDIISARASYPSKTFNVQKILVRKQGKEILQSVEKIGDNTVYTVDNGVLKFRASPEYAPSVFSLVYNDHEWIDNSFPVCGPKSWWNPWCGGLENTTYSIKRSSWHAEKHELSFVTKLDNFSQEWKGIEIITRIENYDALKGISVCQYFLVLPGLPFLATYSTYQQENGFYRNIKGYSRIFFKAGEDFRNTGFDVYLDDKVLHTNCGDEEIEFDFVGKLLACSGKDRKEKLYFYCCQAPVEAYAGSDLTVGSLQFYHDLILKDSKPAASQLKFVILTDLQLPEKALIDLDNIVIS